MGCVLRPVEMGCEAIYRWPLGAVAYCPLLLLTCALLRTSSHSKAICAAGPCLYCRCCSVNRSAVVDHGSNTHHYPRRYVYSTSSTCLTSPACTCSCWRKRRLACLLAALSTTAASSIPSKFNLLNAATIVLRQRCNIQQGCTPATSPFAGRVVGHGRCRSQ